MNIKEKLVENGIKNLHEFGYPECDKDNILTDLVYKAFFISMLKENKGHRPDIDEAIDELLTICKNG